MKYKALNELAAIKIMGYDYPRWREQQAPVDYDAFKPATDMNDAVYVLEKVAQGKGYSIYMFPEEKKPYDVELEVFKVCTDAETLPLAMTVCALRASGVPEREIQAALK